MAWQADGVTPMDVIGEVHCSLTRGQRTFELDMLVVRQLDVDILAGNPFMVCPAKHQIEIYGLKLLTTACPLGIPIYVTCGVHNPPCCSTQVAPLFFQVNMFSSVPLLTLTRTHFGPLSPR